MAEVSGKPTPLEKRCRAMVAGQKERGVYWSPPHRCLNYAKPNGYCPRHQPIEGREEQHDHGKGRDHAADDAEAD